MVILWKLGLEVAKIPAANYDKVKTISALSQKKPRELSESTSNFQSRKLLFMARLTEQEKQEILRYLEADKPLPEKYRFLLFEDKREVELVWNGKTNQVCNIVLPFQTIEQVRRTPGGKAKRY